MMSEIVEYKCDAKYWCLLRWDFRARFFEMKWLILILSLCACAPREESLPAQDEEPRSDTAAAPPSEAAYVWQDEALTWHAWEEVGAVIGRAQRPLLFYVADPE